MSFWRSVLLIPGCLLLFLTAPDTAEAQSVTLPEPPVRSQVDEYDVDVVTRQLQLAETGPSVGSTDDGGMSHIRYRAGSGWRHGYFIAATYVQDPNTYQIIERHFDIGPSRFDFTVSNGVYSNKKGDGATLAEASAAFTLTLRDGTVVVFDRTLGGVGSYYGLVDGLGTTITSPDGQVTSLTYKQDAYYVDYGYGPFPIAIVRLQSANNNRGYQLKYTYATNAPTQANVDDWYRMTRVQAINNGNEYCSPSADACSLGQSWPQVQYGVSAAGTSAIETVTDALGNQRTYTTTPGPYGITGTFSIREPGSGVDNRVYTTWSLMSVQNAITSVTAPGTATRTYDNASGGGYLISDNLGRSRTVVSDANFGVILTDKDALNNTTAYSYDTFGRVLSMSAPEGNSVSYSYDSRGNTLSKSFVPKAGSGLPTSTLLAAYPTTCGNVKTCNLPSWTRDARGFQTDYVYDATHGGVLSVTAPADSNGIRAQIRYSYSGMQAFYKNSTGAIVGSGQNIYRVTSVSACRTTASCLNTADETRATISYGLQSAGTANNLQPVTVTAGSGDGTLSAVNTLSYDKLGNVIAQDGPLPGSSDTTAVRYDALRRVIGRISPDPDGAGVLPNLATRDSFDAAGHLVLSEQGTTPGQNDAAWSAFSASGWRTSTYDDASRKLTDTTRGSDGVIVELKQYSYDGAGRAECAAIRMNPAAYASLPASACTPGTPGGFGPDRIAKLVYDQADQVTSTVSGYGSPAQAADTSTYTANGRVASVTDAKGNRTNYQYDGQDRLLREYFAPASPVGAGYSNSNDYEEYGYDLSGNLVSKRKRDGLVLAFAYDALNRAVSKIVPERSGLSASLSRDVYYGYDLQGRLAFARFDSVTGEGVTNTYNALGHLASSTQAMDGASRTLSYLYDSDGNRTRITHPDGAWFSYDYDAAEQPKGIYDWAGGALDWRTYNARGQLDSRSLSWGANGIRSWSYDPAQRLTSQANSLGVASNDVTFGYSYNPAGQLANASRSNDAYAWSAHVNVDRSYATNGLNQYTSAGMGSPPYGTGFAYDANGNLTSDTTNTYVYDVENRLVAVTGANNATLRYDPLGRLYETGNASGITARFLDDGDALVAEYNAAGTLLRRYVHAATGGDRPIAWFEGSGSADRRWLWQDYQGSVFAVTNANNLRLIANTFDEFGIPGSTNQGRFQYTGQAWIPEAGLYYYKARMYSPTLGRFMQTDPVGYGDGLNWYDYAHSDPVNRSDPLGLDSGGPDIIIVNGQSFNFNLNFLLPSLGGFVANLNLNAAQAGGLSGIGSIATDLTPGEVIVVTAKGAGKFALKVVGAIPDLILEDIFFPSPACCFTAGTLVDTPSGKRAIDELKIGDVVLARDETTGETAAKEIENILPSHDREIWAVTVAYADPAGRETRETYETTDDHPWRTTDGKWIVTALLEEGASLAREQGSATVVAVVDTGKSAATYNLQIADFHSYFVGDAGVWVHNACGELPIVPKQVVDTVQRIRKGIKDPHPNDGTTYRNDDGKLPKRRAGYYTEYVIRTPGVRGPGEQRLVIGRGGETYYTPDHYETFTRYRVP